MSTAQHRLALPSGFQLGRYRLQSVLGSGGFAITYLAQDQTLNRRVAIKELLPNDIATRLDGTTVVAKTESEEKSLGWARQRFMDEGRALAACDHPNVVNVYEMIEANGTAYMVTKYEEGRSLEQWLQELGRRPNESELRSVLTPLLSGLETVHQAGFLHRDIKPENIYMTKNGRPVLLDFGSARQAISNRSMAMTSIVTSGYAPFEQYHDDGKQGAWSDIYALAAVMYRAITGKKPPDATRRLKDDPCEPLATRYAGQYNANFLQAIDRGLAVDESDRPQSVAEWQKMLVAGEAVAPEDAETRVLPRAHKPPPLPTFATVPPPPVPSASAPSAPAGFVNLLTAGKWRDALRHRRMFDVVLPLAVLLFIAFVWGAGHVLSHHKTKGNLASIQAGLVSLLPQSPSEQPPQPSESASPIPNEQTPAPAVTPVPTSPPVAANQLDPRLVGTWEGKTTWPPEGTGNSPVGTWKDATGVRTLLPDGTATRKDTTGKSNDSTGHWEISEGQLVVKDDEIRDGQDIGATYQMTFSADGKQLSGRWSVAEGVPANPSSGEATWDRAIGTSRRQQRVRWEQANDGHYSLSGAFTDTGVISAGDGRIQQFSNNAKQPVEVTYEFHGDKLVTNGPLGMTEWHRIRGSRRESTHSREESGSRRERPDEIGHDLLKRVFRRHRFP